MKRVHVSTPRSVTPPPSAVAPRGGSRLVGWVLSLLTVVTFLLGWAAVHQQTRLARLELEADQQRLDYQRLKIQVDAAIDQLQALEGVAVGRAKDLEGGLARVGRNVYRNTRQFEGLAGDVAAVSTRVDGLESRAGDLELAVGMPAAVASLGPEPHAPSVVPTSAVLAGCRAGWPEINWADLPGWASAKLERGTSCLDLAVEMVSSSNVGVDAAFKICERAFGGGDWARRERFVKERLAAGASCGDVALELRGGK